MRYSTISFPGLGLSMNPGYKFDIGPLSLHYYGLLIALGLLLAAVLLLLAVAALAASASAAATFLLRAVLRLGRLLAGQRLRNFLQKSKCHV